MEYLKNLYPATENEPNCILIPNENILTVSMVENSGLFSGVQGLDSFSFLLLGLLTIPDFRPPSVEIEEEILPIFEEIYDDVVRSIYDIAPHLFPHIKCSFDAVVPYMAYLDQYTFSFNHAKSDDMGINCDGVMMVDESIMERGMVGNAILRLTEDGIACQPTIEGTSIRLPYTSALSGEPLVVA